MDRIKQLETATHLLLEYCRKNKWAGYDPYDGLNSRIFSHTPFRNSRICRIAFIQSMKRLPLNLRPLLLIEKEKNPKALALFLMAFLKMPKRVLPDQDELVDQMIEDLIALRSPGTTYWCWGYSFPWQTRTNLVPKGAPNLVCTVFTADALLEAYEQRKDPRCLTMAASAAEYILNELYWTEGDSVAGFSYPLPGLRARVHNANFLGAALFGRIHKHSGDKRYLETALKITRYSAGRQRPDGSWLYGELPTQSWVDNFHTGYNLCALRSIGQYLGTSEFDDNVSRGYRYYKDHFFLKDGTPKYFHDRVYPLDIHSVAQSIITLLTYSVEDDEAELLAHSVVEWAFGHLWDRKGYFHYQKYPYFTNRIPYMRWSQAWMLLSLSTLLETLNSQCAGNCQRYK